MGIKFAAIRVTNFEASQIVKLIFRSRSRRMIAHSLLISVTLEAIPRKSATMAARKGKDCKRELCSRQYVLSKDQSQYRPEVGDLERKIRPVIIPRPSAATIRRRNPESRNLRLNDRLSRTICCQRVSRDAGIEERNFFRTGASTGVKCVFRKLSNRAFQ